MRQTLVRIDASIRQTGSYSRMLGDYFEQKWQTLHPGATLIRHDLQADPPPHLHAPLANAYFAGDRDQEVLRYSNRLCEELVQCTDLLITCPMYNFGIPATLKNYFDHVVRIRETFQPVAGKGYEGLLKNKRGYLITARGGSRSAAGFDAFEQYLTGMLAFMGIDDIQLISMENTQAEQFPGHWPARFQQQVDQLLPAPVLQG